MRLIGFLLVASELLVGAARADERAAALVLIEGAIQAHGGEAALAKWPVLTVRTEGIFHAYERTPVFFFTCETTTHGAEQCRVVMDGKINVPNGVPNPQKFRIVNVLVGQSAWIHLAGEPKQDTQEASPAQLLEMQEHGYVNWLATLLPLKDKGFTLSLAGEQQDANRTVLGVRVSSKGHRDVTLYFDKETRLLAKTETRGTAGTGKEGKVETVMGRPKEYQGIQRPTQWTVFHDGVSLHTHWVLEYQTAELPAADAFGRP